jgi:GT2 family glycosyltransferase
MNPNTCAYLIVTCNGEATLSALLDSIPSNSTILVIDNDSRDKTKDILKQKGIRCVENHKNRGYGAAINQGLSLLQETHEFVVVLNQDVVLQQFKPDISTLSSYAIIQPLILLPTGQINVNTLAMNVFGYVYPPDFGNLPDYPKTSEPFFFSGAAFIININKWKERGPFDESLFLYYEDVDYAMRLFLAGEKIVFDPSLIVIHAYHNSFSQKEKRTLLAINRKIVMNRYLPKWWRRLIFIPAINTKNNATDQQKWKIASRLLPAALLGFYTKQIPGWKRLCINLFLIPYSFCIRWILKRLTPRL